MTQYKTKKIATLMTGVLWVIVTYAQESVNSSGGNFIGSGGTVSYSVGQTAYTTITGNTGSVAQGVQHSFEIFTVGFEESNLNKISLIAFPNPTTASLSLQLSEYIDEQLTYQLTDMNGKMLSTGAITANHTCINTSNFSAATYFISVVNQEKRIIQTFKIIKN